jgi:formylglycine-generating enzyme required for sulfatase activity
MMATQTTQIIWRKIAELANAKLGSQINPDPSHFKGDKRPVEQVSYDDIQEWLKALNKLSASGEPSLVDVIPDHKKGDVYRLPTEAEWEFVLRGRGQYTEMYNFGEDDEQLSDFAWSKKNANDETHPVAQKLPVVVDGNEFYDMYGNVFEWVADFYHDRLFGGEDPKGPSTGWHRVYRGGGWQDWDTYSRGGAVPETRDNGVGFRFAREARESLP